MGSVLLLNIRLELLVRAIHVPMKSNIIYFNVAQCSIKIPPNVVHVVRL